MRRAPSLALVAIVLCATLSLGFTLLRVNNNPCSDSQHLFWRDRRAVVDTSHLMPSQFATYGSEAIDRWNAAISSFHFDRGSGAFCDPNDGITSMGFAATVCDGKSFGDAVNVTFFRFNPNNGEMLDADVTFDASDPSLGNRALFTQIAMHELGHVLGLGHSDACGASGAGTLMKTVTFLNDPQLDSPQADDVAGALTIYPGGDGTVPEGANSCHIDGSGKRRAPWELFLLPLLLLAVRLVSSARAGDATGARVVERT